MLLDGYIGYVYAFIELRTTLWPYGTERNACNIPRISLSISKENTITQTTTVPNNVSTKEYTVITCSI